MELPKSVEELLTVALSEASNSKSEALEPAHLFVAACRLENSPLIQALEAQNIAAKALRRKVRSIAYGTEQQSGDETQRISNRVWRIFDNAKGRAEALKHELSIVHLTAALLRHPDSALQRVFDVENLPVRELIDYLEQVNASGRVSAAFDSTIHMGDHPATPVLDKFGQDYTALARAGGLDPVIGRRDETKQVVRILLQKQKNNAVLVGDAGVGKTSIVEGLALRVVAGDAPAEIRNWRIVELSLSAMVAGTKYRGEFEERLQQVIDEAESDHRLILFLDELHILVGAGQASGSMDAANILKPALARGRIRLIGATTPDEYRNSIEKDSALERRFQPVRLDEPTMEETRRILTELRNTYEAHHQVEITDEAIDAAVELSVKHLPDRRLPDKARDLIDRAAVAKRFITFSANPAAKTDDKRVTRQDVAQVIAQWTGIPIEQLAGNEPARLLDLENVLGQRVVGQDHAITALANAIKTAMSGLSDPSRPYGVFLFLGPTGVGKTELAKALAEFLFGDEDRLIRFDMSEFMEEHSVSKLIGAPPGYVGHDEGGALTNAVRKQPYSVLLFDEVEKAHPRVLDIFLQLFDDGRLTDSHGHTADFRHTVIIMTSNLQNAEKNRPIPGFRPAVRADEVEAAGDNSKPDKIRELLLQRFRPELINRIDQVIQFNRLGPEQLRLVIDKIMSRVRQRIGEKRIELKLSPAAFDVLLKLGFQSEVGAREMERVIERNIVQPLAQGMLAGDFDDGDHILIDARGDEIVLMAEATTRIKVELTTGEVLLTTMKPEDRTTVTMFLTDVVKSTDLVKSKGDTFLMHRMRDLHDAIRAHQEFGGVRFVKFTGDGFLVLVDDVALAIELARDLRSLASMLSLDLRFVIHQGAVRIEFDGDPIGAEVHRLFRIEALNQDQCVAPVPGRTFPDHSRIVITPAALGTITWSDRADFEEIGDFALKGFDEPQEIWAERKK